MLWLIDSKDLINNPVLIRIIEDWRGIDEKIRTKRLIKGKAKGLFSGMKIKSGQNIALPKGFCDLFVVE